MSKVILDTDVPEIKGKLKVGTICLFSGGALKPKKEKVTQNYERYDNLFSEKLKAKGFTVVTTSSDLFAGDKDQKADFLIGATMRPDTLNMCSSVNGEKGDVTINVEWQVYDRAGQAVVETVTTSGHGEQIKFAGDGFEKMWNAAFIDSLDQLIAKGVVQKHLGAPGS